MLILVILIGIVILIKGVSNIKGEYIKGLIKLRFGLERTLS